jgi:hypothetical protein
MTREREALDAVENINSDLWDTLSEAMGETSEMQQLHADSSLKYMSTGHYECVEFLGKTIWDTECAGVPWDDARDEKECSVHEWLLRQMNSTVQSMAFITKNAS